MQAVTQTRSGWLLLRRGDVAVAVVVSRSRIVEDSDRLDDRPIHLHLDYLVTVLCFSAVSVVHMFFVVRRALTGHFSEPGRASGFAIDCPLAPGR